MTEAKKYKILIIDDDSFLLQMYTTKFKNSGYDVMPMDSSTNAIDKLKDGYNPDVILIDIVMPGLDGLETLEVIHKENLAQDAVYIMLTNQSSPDDIEKAKELGIHGYIVKATTIPSEVVDEVIKIREKANKDK